MEGTASDSKSLLADIVATPRERRAERVRAIGEPNEVLGRLAEEAERWTISELGRALEATEALVDLGDEIGGRQARARGQRARAQALAYANRFDDALAALDKSVALAEAATDPLAAARRTGRRRLRPTSAQSTAR